VVVVSAQAPRVRGMLQDKNLPEVPLEYLISGKGAPPPLPPRGRKNGTGDEDDFSSAPPVVGAGGGLPSGIALVNGVLRSGFKVPDARLVVFSDAEIFGAPADAAKKEAKRRREFREGMRITSLLDLKESDYVVHIHHGIGVYHGLTRMKVQGVEKEYLLIRYEGGDKLYVPVDQVDRVQKYIGSEGGAPSVNKLGGLDWAKTTAKAKRQVKEIAKDLIELYAARQAAPGHAYAPDTPWQMEMEDAFPIRRRPTRRTPSRR
jgi:transcription-repair coupling factor (superfamily II helicase)